MNQLKLRKKDINKSAKITKKDINKSAKITKKDTTKSAKITRHLRYLTLPSSQPAITSSLSYILPEDSQMLTEKLKPFQRTRLHPGS